MYLLQETHNDNHGHEQRWEMEWGGRCLWNRGTNQSRGVAILLPRGSTMIISNIRKDTEGRVLAATLNDTDTDTQLNVMNIYAPNSPGERHTFFHNLWQYKPGDANLFLAGDFNCVERHELDRHGGNSDIGKQGMAALKQFVDDNNLHDAWHTSHPNDRVYTWYSKDYSQRSRLDRWYVRRGSDRHSTIRVCPYSDHSVVELDWTVIRRKARGKTPGS